MRKGVILATVAATTLLVGSCKEYYDDMADIGKALESQEHNLINTLNEKLELLKNLYESTKGINYITEIIENPDGSFSLRFSNDPDRTWTVQQGVVGEKGLPGDDVRIRPVYYNGTWYWEIDGVRTSVGIAAQDGTGIDPNTLPQLRISDEGYWQVRYGNNDTWKNLTVTAYDDNGNPYEIPFAAKGDNGDPDPFFAEKVIPIYEGGQVIAIKIVLTKTFGGGTFILYVNGGVHDVS